MFRMMALLVAVVCFEKSQIAVLAQTTQQRENHAVGARLEAGSTDRELSLVFTVSPVIRVLPIVRWLGVEPLAAKTLTVRSDVGGHYSAALGDIQNLDNGQLLIELSDVKSGLHELHGLDFTLREIATNGPSSSPSRDGHFVMYTRPNGVLRASRLLISSGEQPIGPLPAGVSAGAVMAVYSLDVLPSVKTIDGWRLAIATAPSDEKTILFYLAKGGKSWKRLESSLIEGHPLLNASVPGPGTYLLAQGVKR
jgi:hypothetical protein